MESFVYIIGDLTHNVYKIGKADCVKDRCYDLKCGNPFLKIFRIFRYKDSQCALAAEKSIHKRFTKKRFYREWFELSKEDILKVAKYAKARRGYQKKSIAQIIAFSQAKPVFRKVGILDSEDGILKFMLN